MTSRTYLLLHIFAPLFGTSRVVQKTLQGYTSLHNVPHTVPHNFKCKFAQKTASAGQRGTQCPAHCPARFRRQIRKTIASAGQRGTVAGQLSRVLSRAILKANLLRGTAHPVWGFIILKLCESRGSTHTAHTSIVCQMLPQTVCIVKPLGDHGAP